MVRAAKTVARAFVQRRESWTLTRGWAGATSSREWREGSSKCSRQEPECLAAVAQATAQAAAPQVQQIKERQRQAEASCLSFAYQILAKSRTDTEHHAGQRALTDGRGGTAISAGTSPATSCFAMFYHYVGSMLEVAWRRGDVRSELAAQSSATSSDSSIVLARPSGPATPGFTLYISGAFARFWHHSRHVPSQQDPASVGAAPQPASCFAIAYLYMAWGGPKATSKNSSASTAVAVAATAEGAAASAAPIAARPGRKVCFAIALEDQFPNPPGSCRIPTETSPRSLVALPDLPRGGPRLKRQSLSDLILRNSQRSLLPTTSQETTSCFKLQHSKRSAAISSAAQRSHSDCARVFLNSGRRDDGLARGGWRSHMVPVAAAPILMMVPAFLACDFTASAMKVAALMHLLAMMFVSLSCMAAD